MLFILRHTNTSAFIIAFQEVINIILTSIDFALLRLLEWAPSKSKFSFLFLRLNLFLVIIVTVLLLTLLQSIWSRVKKLNFNINILSICVITFNLKPVTKRKKCAVSCLFGYYFVKVLLRLIFSLKIVIFHISLVVNIVIFYWQITRLYYAISEFIHANKQNKILDKAKVINSQRFLKWR